MLALAKRMLHHKEKSRMLHLLNRMLTIQPSLNTQGKAEVLALAKRMLHRKEKESIMDAAYNRYAFHDTEKMPRWFKDDEARHMR